MFSIPTYSTLPDVLNAFVRAAVENGAGDDEAFWSRCSSEFGRLHGVYEEAADSATSFEDRLRQRSMSELCERLASASDDEGLVPDLRAVASAVLERAKKVQGEGREYLLQEFRLSMLLAHASYEDFGLTREVFLAHLEQCAQPA